MVGGLDLAARGLHGAGEHLFAHGCERRVDAREVRHHAAQIERARVDGVVNARVADETRHVERLGDAHGARGADADRGRRSLERRGGERRGRLLLARLAGDVHDRARGGPIHMRERRGRGLVVGKARGLVADLEALVLRGALGRGKALDLPVILGFERHALALALDHQGERRGLHTAGGAHVAKAAEFGEREIAREHRAPDEVDMLAALAGVGQVLVERHEVIEGRGDLGLGERRVLGTAHRQVGRDLAHLVERVGADQLALAIEVRGDHHGVGLFGEVLERADELLLGRHLDDGRPGKIRQALELPALDGDAVGQVRAALALVRRARETVGHIGRQDLALLGHRVPALFFIEEDRLAKIGRQDMTGQADGHALLALPIKAVDRGVIDLVFLGFARGKTLGDLARGVVLLGDDELHGEAPSRISVSAAPALSAGDLRPYRPRRRARNNGLKPTTPCERLCAHHKK